MIVWLLPEKVFKNSSTQYSCYVMESRVTTGSIHSPSMPEKEVNWKENTVRKIAKRQQIWKSTHAQIPILAKLYSIV